MREAPGNRQPSFQGTLLFRSTSTHSPKMPPSPSSPDATMQGLESDELHLPFLTEERDFLNCVKSRETTLENEEVAHYSTSVCHLGHIALRVGNGVRLQWDPKAERFTNSDEANKFLALPDTRDRWSYEKIVT